MWEWDLKKVPRTPLAWGTHRVSYQKTGGRGEPNEGLTWSVSALRVSVKVLSKCSGCSANRHIRSITHTHRLWHPHKDSKTWESLWVMRIDFPSPINNSDWSIGTLSKTNSGGIVSLLAVNQRLVNSASFLVYFIEKLYTGMERIVNTHGPCLGIFTTWDSIYPRHTDTAVE